MSTSDPNETPLPSWYQPPGVKTKYDFPRAKRGGPDRVEFTIRDRKPGRPRRIDKYLMERFGGYSRSFLQQLIKQGRVLVNGKTIKPSWHISEGEVITVLLPPATVHQPEEIAFQVLYQDEAFLGVVKPAGIIIHPARGNKTGTLYNGLLHHFREERAKDPSFHIGIVHRLDEFTSGVMVVALTQAANKEFTRQFENRLLQKSYLCIVHGRPSFLEKEIDAPLGVDPACRTKVAVQGLDARPSLTRYVRLACAEEGEFALLRAFPKTGRSHQIRVHAAALGHPLVGDLVYGGRDDCPEFGPLRPRVCLHAEALEFTHPTRGHPMRLAAPLPEDLRQVARCLGIRFEEEPAWGQAPNP